MQASPWYSALPGSTDLLTTPLYLMLTGLFRHLSCSLGTATVCAGLPVGHGGHALPPLAAAVTAATSVPLQPPAAVPRKHVELVLVQNPGDDVCFAKEDERRGP